MKLKYLSSLSHERIDAALSRTQYSFPLFVVPKQEILESPFQRLFHLLADKTPESFCILSTVLGGNAKDDSNFLGKKSKFIKASEIFLKFKIEGNHYRSENGNNNSCLHDALNCGYLKFQLIHLLLKHGADPDQENDAQSTALLHYWQSFDQDMPQLFSVNRSSQQKVINYIAYQMTESKAPVLNTLKEAKIFGFFQKYPNSLDYQYEETIGYGRYLLHMAVCYHSEEVVDWIFSQGVDIEVRDHDGLRPIDLAVAQWVNNNHYRREQYPAIITYLLLHALPPNAAMPDSVIDALLALDFPDHYRKIICKRIFERLPDIFIKSIQERIYAALETIKHPNIFWLTTIGSGSYGNVWLAQQRHETIAIKLSKQPMGNYQLRSEAAIHTNLKHPNIIEFKMPIERDGFFGIVMEYAEGSLQTVLDNYHREKTVAALFPRCFYPFLRQIHAAIQYMHQQNLVHLDIKPVNILVSSINNYQLPNATIKLADFGATTTIGKLQREQTTTHEYCSPEGFSNIAYTVAHDTFSLGIVIGQLDTKSEPWLEILPEIKKQAEEKKIDVYELFNTSVQNKVCHGERTNFANKTMQPKVAHLVQWCCRQKPQDRPNDEDIEAYIEQNFSLM